MLTGSKSVRLRAPRASGESRARHGGPGLSPSVWLGRAALLAAFLLLWQFADVLGIIPRSGLPEPMAVATALFGLIGTVALWSAVGQTLVSWALGLGIALIVGNIAGALIGSNAAIVRSTRFVVDFFRSVPSVALVPLALLMFGSNLQMKLLLIVFGATWDVLIQALYAVRQVDPVARETLDVYGVSRWQQIWSLRVPSAAPYLMTGLRIASIHALMLAIGSEIIGGATGLGLQLTTAQDEGAMAAMYAYIIVVGVVGVLINNAVLLLQRRVLHWHADFRKDRA